METSTPTSGKTDSQPMDHHNQARTRSLLTRSAVLACGRSSVAVTSRVLILLNRWSGMLPPFLEIAVTPNAEIIMPVGLKHAISSGGLVDVKENLGLVLDSK